MTTPTDAPRRSVLDLLRSLVRQLAAAVYALVAFFALSSFVTVDAWASVALQGTCGAFGGWLLARMTAGPWWSWVFMGPWLGLLDLGLNVSMLSMTTEPLPWLTLVRTVGPGSLALVAVTLLGSIAGRRGANARGGSGAGNQAQPAPAAPPATPVDPTP